MRKTNILFVLAVLLYPALLSAHTAGLSKGTYTATDSGLTVELVFARSEVMHAGIQKIIDGLEVRRSSAICAAHLQDATETEQDGFLIRASYHCSQNGNITVKAGFLPMLEHGHRHVAILPDVSSELVLYKGNSEFHITGRQQQQVFLSLLRLGVEHILTGYDHLLFLLGLILIGGNFRSLLVVVSSFTLAHSIALASSALDIWRPNPGVVEPAIALSIAYIGVENWFIRNADRRWLITFLFGLIHGFGFAGALAEISFPPGQIPLALASFNLGVEAGQMLFVAVLLPMILWLRKKTWFAQSAVKALSSGIAVAGVVWLILRTT